MRQGVPPLRDGAVRREQHAITGVVDDATLDAVIAAAGLVVVEGCPFRGPAQEVNAHGLLGIARGLPRLRVRWLKAHGLGHHVLPHRGNHTYAAHKMYLWVQQELEAELFARTRLRRRDLVVGAP